MKGKENFGNDGLNFSRTKRRISLFMGQVCYKYLIKIQFKDVKVFPNKGHGKEAYVTKTLKNIRFSKEAI